jgi:hypothetical protein
MTRRTSRAVGLSFVGAIVAACSSSSSTTSGPGDSDAGTGAFDSGARGADGASSVDASNGTSTDASVTDAASTDAAEEAGFQSCPPDLALGAPITGMYQYDASGGPVPGGQGMTIADGTYTLTALTFYTLDQSKSGPSGAAIAQTMTIAGGNMQWTGQTTGGAVRSITATFTTNTSNSSLAVTFTCGTNKNPTGYGGGYYFSGTELQLWNFVGIMSGYGAPGTLRAVATFTKS